MNEVLEVIPIRDNLVWITFARSGNFQLRFRVTVDPERMKESPPTYSWEIADHLGACWYIIRRDGDFLRSGYDVWHMGQERYIKRIWKERFSIDVPR